MNNNKKVMLTAKLKYITQLNPEKLDFKSHMNFETDDYIEYQ